MKIRSFDSVPVALENAGAELAGLKLPVVPAGGWLRSWREARRRPQRELAAELGCQRQAWAQFELSEQRGAISLGSLRRAAAVLGCDLVYALVPREGPAPGVAPGPDGGDEDELPIALR